MAINDWNPQDLQDFINTEDYDTLLREFGDAFESTFNDANDDVAVAGGTFYASEVLKACDPIAYREEFFSFLDFLLAEAEANFEPETDDE